MTQVAEENLVALLPYDFLFTETCQTLDGFVEGGDLSFDVHSEDTNAQVLKKLAELLMQDMSFGG
jgi:hypothetical protein